MPSANQAAAVSKASLWAGRIISAIVVLFMIFDGVTKLLKVAPVLAAMARLEIPVNLTVGIGSLLLVCTAVYAIPQTSVLGAILLTGYLGGAVAINLRAGDPLFETLFPVIFGVLVWGGIWFRHDRLRTLIPFSS